MVPAFEQFLDPYLHILQDGAPRTYKEMCDAMRDHFHLSQEDCDEILPSGTQTRLMNRVYWCATYFFKAKLIEGLNGRPRKIKISEQGITFLRKHPKGFTRSDLMSIPQFAEFKSASPTEKHDEPLIEDKTPTEILEDTFNEVQESLATDLLEQLQKVDPKHFEKIVVDLVVKMGYGAGEPTRYTKDDGIDGIINEDALGLGIIYIQAKRWINSVGKPELQKFAGAIIEKGSRKGIFITTSTFSKEAQQYKPGSDLHIILIDGHRLAQLMIEHNVGVSIRKSYEVKRIDSDYFDDEI